MNREIFHKIYFVGYVDWTIREFHSFEAKRGVTYNSYLVCDEKVALIDTVKAPFSHILCKNIEEQMPLEKIDYIIVNHAEPDHAGALFEIVKKCKNAKVVCTQKCKETLSFYFDTKDFNFQIVKTKDTISLGKRTLEFIETPMVHWPESMFTFLKEDKILFSMDGFGQHYCFSKIFDDEADFCEVMDEAKKYYANILMPLGKPILNALEKLSSYELKAIVPAHGIIWRKNIDKILSSYKEWASFTSKPKVVILYDTMWQSTKLMAEAILKGVESFNVEVKLFDVKTTDLTIIATEVLDASFIAFGSPTLNCGMMPMMGAVLTYLKGLSPKNKQAVVFGTYGWGRGSVEEMEEKVKEMKIDILTTLKVRWKPRDEEIKACFEMGREIAKKTLNKN